MPGLDLASLVTNAISSNAGMQQASARIGALNETGQSVAQSQVDNANAAADAEDQKTQIDLDDKARQEQQMNALAIQLGGDPTKAGSFILQAGEETKRGMSIVSDAEERIHAKNSVGFFDDPIQWMVNKATIGKDIEDYRYGATIVNNADELAMQMSKIQDLGFKQIASLSNVYSQSYITAAKTLAAYRYNQDATQAQLQGVRAGIEGIHAAASIDAQGVGLLFQANSAQAQQKQIDIALQHLQIARQDYDIKADAVKQKKSEDDVALGYIAQGYFNMTGGTTMPESERSNALARMKFKDPRIAAWFDSGLQSSMMGGKPVIDTSPYRASNLIATHQVTNWASPAMAQVGEQLVSWRKEFENQPLQNQTYDPKDPTAKEKAFNQFVAGKVTNNPEQYPIFQPMRLQDFTNVNPKFKTLPVWDKVLGPAQQAGANVDDPNVAFGILSAATAEGKLSYPDAIDYSRLVAGALNAKNQGNNLLAFGISQPKKFVSNIKLTQEFGSDRVNVVDQLEFSRALNKSMGIRATMVDQGTLGKVMGPVSSGISAGYGNTLGRVQFGPKPTYPGDEEDRLKAGK